jgi:hypothetical protein
MPNDVTQFYNPDDGCIYFYDEQKQRYRKVCDIPSFDELPLSIKRQIKAAKEAAGRILRMPGE